MAAEQLRRLIARRAYAELRDLLAACALEDLAAIWAGLKPIEKLTLFKLLEPVRALAFYSGMDVGSKYLLLCAFDLGAIAPVLEDLPAQERALFVKLPASYYDRMLHKLCREQVEIEVAVGTN